MDKHVANLLTERLVAWTRGEQPGPFSLELDPEDRCTLNCCDCPLPTEGRESLAPDLEPDRLLALAREGIQLGVLRWRIGVSESLLYSEPAREALALIRASGGWIELRARGTLHRPEHVRRLTSMGLGAIEVAVDGARPETNDSLRGYRGVLASTLESMRVIHQDRKRKRTAGPLIHWRTVLTRVNYRELPELVELAVEKGVARLTLDPLRSCTVDAIHLTLDKDQRREFDSILEGCITRAGLLGLEHNLADHRSVELTASGAAPPLPPRLPLNCLTPWYHLVVRPGDAISPCCTSVDRWEEQAGGGLQQAWLGSYANRIRLGVLQGEPPAECLDCQGRPSELDRRLIRELLVHTPPEERPGLHRRWVGHARRDLKGARRAA